MKINEKLYKQPTKISELANDSGFLTRADKYIVFSSTSELRNYFISSQVPSGSMHIFSAVVNGQGSGIILQKTSNLYLSFIMFNYSGTLEVHKYTNGTWNIKNL